LLLDVVEWLKDRVASIAEAIRQHPLKLAYPDGDLGQLGRVRIDFEAQ
jgi:hypothetical protein